MITSRCRRAWRVQPTAAKNRCARATHPCRAHRTSTATADPRADVSPRRTKHAGRIEHSPRCRAPSTSRMRQRGRESPRMHEYALRLSCRAAYRRGAEHTELDRRAWRRPRCEEPRRGERQLGATAAMPAALDQHHDERAQHRRREGTVVANRKPVACQAPQLPAGNDVDQRRAEHADGTRGDDQLRGARQSAGGVGGTPAPDAADSCGVGLQGRKNARKPGSRGSAMTCRSPIMRSVGVPGPPEMKDTREQSEEPHRRGDTPRGMPSATHARPGPASRARDRPGTCPTATASARASGSAAQCACSTPDAWKSAGSMFARQRFSGLVARRGKVMAGGERPEECARLRLRDDLRRVSTIRIAMASFGHACTHAGSSPPRVGRVHMSHLRTMPIDAGTWGTS